MSLVRRRGGGPEGQGGRGEGLFSPPLLESDPVREALYAALLAVMESSASGHQGSKASGQAGGRYTLN